MTTRKPKEKKTRKKLDPEKKRLTSIQSRVTCQQKKEIEAISKKCGFKSVSDFILARCYGYEPKAMLTPEQSQQMQELVYIRADIANVVNALGMLSPDEKKAHFKSFNFMHQWIMAMENVRQRIRDWLDKFSKTEDIPVLHGKTTKAKTETI